ncbi:MAG: ABC transporter substrate-binding protein [bacterium]
MQKIINCFLLVSLFSSFCFAGDLKKVKFTTHWIPQAQFAGYYYAKEKGIYKKYGLDVEIKSSGIVENSQEILAKNETDFALMFFSSALTERTKNRDIVNVAQLSQKSALIYLTKKSSGIRIPEDFEGKKVGIWRTGFEEIPYAFFKKYNVDVTIVPLAFSVNLFILGGIDVMTVMWYNEYHAIINSGINQEELVPFFFSKYGLDVPEDGIYCNRSYYLNNSETCKKFVQATLEGWKEAFKNPETALDIVIKYMNNEKIAANRAHQKWMLNRIQDVFMPKDKSFKFGVFPEVDYYKTLSLLKSPNNTTNYPSYNNFVIQQ